MWLPCSKSFFLDFPPGLAKRLWLRPGGSIVQDVLSWKMLFARYTRLACHAAQEPKLFLPFLGMFAARSSGVDHVYTSCIGTDSFLVQVVLEINVRNLLGLPAGSPDGPKVDPPFLTRRQPSFVPAELSARSGNAKLN